MSSRALVSKEDRVMDGGIADAGGIPANQVGQEINFSGSNRGPGDELRDELRSRREQMTQEAATKLEGALEHIKSLATNMLTEIEAFMTTSEEVIFDYETVLVSQQSEAQRLASVEPDVAGGTQSFF
uniref:Uncharacterized protein n=1 Tax=Cyclophora tenuis TaxID=216820 RepID=A0A7S1DC29_CYCTE|mmetsp:Transcript_6051/g.10569  ORF Transcript_6051/g.10569 Transcript_6051/m.10569 type:complete len:127 (+) Transcript_6051:310-690(+)